MSDGVTGLRIEQADAVLRLTLDRPDALNALAPEQLDAATEAVRAAGDDAGVRVIVLAASGRAFCAGADIADTSAPPSELIGTLDSGNALVAAITSSPKPVVAAVQGAAAGIGATIALSCDLVVARRSAYFLLAFVNIALLPDGGATAIVPAAIGRARAYRMALLGERIPAEQAYDWGLISHLAEDDSFDAEVEAVVTKLAGSATQALARTKAALAISTLGTLSAAHETERESQLALFDTDDFVEGIAAFREKRPARFTGS